MEPAAMMSGPPDVIGGRVRQHPPTKLILHDPYPGWRRLENGPVLTIDLRCYLAGFQAGNRLVSAERVAVGVRVASRTEA